MFSAPRGTRDILTPLVDSFTELESLARKKAKLWGFSEIRTPTFEEAGLYGASVGAATDIVEKEMFSFTDRGERHLALRPEGTAGVVRAYLEHSIGKQEPKSQFFYIENMFRAERPQAGRFREFEQIGFEIFGDASPLADSALIALALDILTEFGLKDLAVSINSIGCPVCRGPYREKLIAALKKIRDILCETCKGRLEKNPMRVLDCKTCGPKIEGIPLLEKCADCLTHEKAVKEILDGQKIAFIEDPKLVRGLDYYTRTVFEINSGKLGSQSAVCGGGRYDGLVELLGGSPTPATGFALGVDRAVQALGEGVSGRGGEREIKIMLVLASVESKAHAAGLSIATLLRKQGCTVLSGIPGASIKSQMRQANKAGASYCLILGDEELKQGVYALKNLKDGSQKSVPLGEVPGELKINSIR